MKRSSKKHSGRTPSRSDMTRFPLTASISVTLASGANIVQLAPTTIGVTRLSQTADCFEMYRISKLAYRLRRTSQTQPMAATWIAGVVETSPTTIASVTQSPNYTMLMATETVPSNWVKVPKEQLKSYMAWYKTIPGTTVDLAEEAQGNIYVVGSGTENVYLDIRALYEFRVPVNTGVTPEVRRKRELLLLQSRIQRVLSFRDEPGASQTPSVDGRGSVQVPSAALQFGRGSSASPSAPVPALSSLEERLRTVELLLKGTVNTDV